MSTLGLGGRSSSQYSPEHQCLRSSFAQAVVDHLHTLPHLGEIIPPPNKLRSVRNTNIQSGGFLRLPNILDIRQTLAKTARSRNLTKARRFAAAVPATWPNLDSRNRVQTTRTKRHKVKLTTELYTVQKLSTARTSPGSTMRIQRAR